jgi:hypothetical protein
VTRAVRLACLGDQHLRAGLVTLPEEYRWSSTAAHLAGCDNLMTHLAIEGRKAKNDLLG